MGFARGLHNPSPYLWVSQDQLLMFARNAEFLKPESVGDKQLLKVSYLSFKLSHMGLNPFTYSIKKL